VGARKSAIADGGQARGLPLLQSSQPAHGGIKPPLRFFPQPVKNVRKNSLAHPPCGATTGAGGARFECGNLLPLSAPRDCSRESHLPQFSALYTLRSGAQSPASELAGRKKAASCRTQSASRKSAPARTGPLTSPPSARFGHYALAVVLLAFGVMFLVSIDAFLRYILTLACDRWRARGDPCRF
jgi:hypothetical protein